MIRITGDCAPGEPFNGGWRPLPLDREMSPEKGRCSVRKDRALKAQRVGLRCRGSLPVAWPPRYLPLYRLSWPMATD